jgi:hypothetical protein
VKCWFRVKTDKDDAEWVDGHISGGRPSGVLVLGGKIGCTILDASYHFDLQSLRITGYLAERDGAGYFVFRRASWEVVFSKPRVKKGTSK